MPDPSPVIMAADRVPWLGLSRPAVVIDIDPKRPWARPATVSSIDARRIITKSQNRFLQSQLTEIPYGSGHYGYRSISGPTVLVGPDNPHIPMIEGYVARNKLLKGLQDAWQTLWLARDNDPAMREAAAAMISKLDHYLKDGTK